MSGQRQTASYDRLHWIWRRGQTSTSPRQIMRVPKRYNVVHDCTQLNSYHVWGTKYVHPYDVGGSESLSKRGIANDLRLQIATQLNSRLLLERMDL